jgi:hypothetical protein
VPKSLVLLFLALAGCAHVPEKIYPNSGAPNAVVKVKAEAEFLLHKSFYLEISTENAACVASDLGLLEITKQNQAVAIPTGRVVNVNVLFEKREVLGGGGEQNALSFRWVPAAGAQYVLEVIDHGRSRGFQVYRGGKEVAFLSRAGCGL